MHRSAASSSSAASSAEQPATVSSSSISAEQPPTSLRSAAQPASEKRAVDFDPSGGASGSAARPATLVEQVEQLGHYPKRFKTPATDEERAENSLAMNISKQWSNLNGANKAKLTRLQQETQGKDAEKQAEIMESRRKAKIVELEHSLADKIGKQWSKLICI